MFSGRILLKPSPFIRLWLDFGVGCTEASTQGQLKERSESVPQKAVFSEIVKRLP